MSQLGTKEASFPCLLWYHKTGYHLQIKSLILYWLFVSINSTSDLCLFYRFTVFSEELRDAFDVFICFPALNVVQRLVVFSTRWRRVAIPVERIGEDVYGFCYNDRPQEHWGLWWEMPSQETKISPSASYGSDEDKDFSSTESVVKT